MSTKPKPSIDREVARMHARNLSDGEMAKRIGVSVQQVTATRKRLNLRPHLVIKGRKHLNYVPSDAARFRPGVRLSEAKIAELYAGRRYG